MNYVIKSYDELNSDELYEILRVRNEVFVVEQQCIYQDCDNKDKMSHHLFLTEDNKIIAYLRILEKGISYDEVSIGRVLVTENHRGKGLAKNIMIEAINFIKNHMNTTEIRISAQAYLLKFYTSIGFKSASDEYLEDDIPHVEMIYNP